VSGVNNLSEGQIEGLRKQIDLIDETVFHLLGQRLNLVRQIAPLKRTSGFPVYCPEREKEICDRIQAVKDEDLRLLLLSVYREIFSHARQLQVR
jgi:chorismate mutase